MKDSIYNASTLVLLAILAAASWIAKGLLIEARDRVGRRIADWLFPLGQPLTYRAALMVLAGARGFAPRARVSFELVPLYAGPASQDVFLPSINPRLRHHRLDWEDLEAAVAELEVNEQLDAPIAKPLQFVGPLFLRVLGIRLGNAVARVAFVIWFLLIRPLFLFALFVLWLLLYLIYASLLPFAWVYRRIASWVVGTLLRSAIERLPDDMERQERELWVKLLEWDATRQPRRILTRRFAMELWVRRRLRLPDPDSVPAVDWRVARMRATGEINSELHRR